MFTSYSGKFAQMTGVQKSFDNFCTRLKPSNEKESTFEQVCDPEMCLGCVAGNISIVALGKGISVLNELKS